MWYSNTPYKIRHHQWTGWICQRDFIYSHICEYWENPLCYLLPSTWRSCTTMIGQWYTAMIGERWNISTSNVWVFWEVWCGVNRGFLLTTQRHFALRRKVPSSNRHGGVREDSYDLGVASTNLTGKSSLKMESFWWWLLLWWGGVEPKLCLGDDVETRLMLWNQEISNEKTLVV